MSEKKQIKVSLGTAICIFIIVLLLIALVCEYVYFSKKDEVKFNNEPKQQEKNEEKVNDETEPMSKVSNKKFIIKDIKEKEDKYEVEVNILENKRQVFSEEEYNKILNGEKFKFRGREWKISKEIASGQNITVVSGNKKLEIHYDNAEKCYYLENKAGAKTGGLEDCSDDIVKFEVDKDIYIGDPSIKFVSENGKVKVQNVDGTENDNSKISTMKDLIEWNSENEANYSGSYEEYNATVIDGKIVALSRLF